MRGAGLGRGAHQRADNLQQAWGVLAHADTQQLHQQPQRNAPPRGRAPLVTCRPVPGRTEAAELGTCSVSIRTGRNADGRDLQRPDLHVLVTPRALQSARQARGEHPAEGQAGGRPGTPAPRRLTFVWRATALSKPAAD